LSNKSKIMRQFLILLLSTLFLVSCQDDVKFNNPGFQATINNELWKANPNITKVTRDLSGVLVIKGTSGFYDLELNVASDAVGTYVLGTTNQSNLVNYSPINTIDTFYTTGITKAPVSTVNLVNGGTGYISASAVSTTGGSGTELKVNVVANSNGVITGVEVSVSGNDYIPGDIITIVGGNNDAKFEVVSVSKSGGEIVITENTGTTISGNFKFLAFDQMTNQVVSCRDGVFYKLPITN
jgi:Family of unknown function (DUF6252)